MAEDRSGYKHDASDKKLDQSAHIDEDGEKGAATGGQGHDPEEIRKHNTTGKDRMFEGREQHDEHDLHQEKNRLAKDQARHNHPVEGEDAVTESNMHVKRKKD